MEITNENCSWEANDPHLKRLQELPFNRNFDFSKYLEPGFFIIRGPRQVGKSTLLKQLLQQASLLKKRAYYLSCENIKDYQELSELLKSLKGKYDYVCLDEVTFVHEWWRAIKHVVDSSYFENLMITGSGAQDLRKGADRMPGRFQLGGGEFYLWPMNFQEFLKARKDASWKKLNKVDSLNLYFQTGGFPTAVAHCGEKGIHKKDILDIYKRWVLGEALKQGKDELSLFQVLRVLAKSLSTPLSFQSIAQKAQLGSHNTAKDYIQFLEDSFVLRTLYKVDLDTGAFKTRSNRKFYFSDPLIYWMVLDYFQEKSPREVHSLIAEQVAHEAIAQHVNHPFGYVETKKGEIDFVKNKEWALEVKWSQNTGNLSTLYKETFFPWKKVWNQHNFLEEWMPDQTD